MFTEQAASPRGHAEPRLLCGAAPGTLNMPSEQPDASRVGMGGMPQQPAQERGFSSNVCPPSTPSAEAAPEPAGPPCARPAGSFKGKVDAGCGVDRDQRVTAPLPSQVNNLRWLGHFALIGAENELALPAGRGVLPDLWPVRPRPAHLCRSPVLRLPLAPYF